MLFIRIRYGHGKFTRKSADLVSSTIQIFDNYASAELTVTAVCLFVYI